MDQGVMLTIALGALGLVVAAWAVREIVGLVRRRRAAPDARQRVADAAVELVPLLIQPIAALVKNIGRNRTSIDSLVGPDGTVALMFSDIEGSTSLNHQLGDDEWVRLIRAHDAIVARAVKRHDGQIVKTQGDGFMAAFRTPDEAIAAAMSLGASLEASDTIDVPLAVRVGVHAGQVVSENGDLFGTNVAMAARIADAARGNEVLVSDAVRREVAGTPGLRFRRRKAVRFKGLPGRHATHIVTSEPIG
jgi:class 3 adenylate cyclase